MELRCPICKKPVLDRSSRSFPFCSHRCQMVDLGRWVEEDYAIPGEKLIPDELDQAREGRKEEEDRK